MKEKMLFVGGDVCGIQKFIYNISSKKAAMSLKGRSAYLVDYTNEVYDRLRPMFVENGDVYSSGGKFYAIVEDTPENREAINRLQCEVDRELWEAHFGQLAMNICSVSFEVEDGDVNRLNRETLSQLFNEINAQFGRAKNQKFQSLLTDRFDEMFNPISVSGHQHVCAITGIESNTCVKLEGSDDIYVLPSVNEQVKRGRQLRAGRRETYEDYAKRETSEERSNIGILRMDVDGLGKKFSAGFDSLKEYKKFSHLVSDFFDEKAGELAHICKPYQKELEIVYAGGDDLFAVGHWNSIISFAREVSGRFAAYMQEHKQDGVTLSGGVAIVDAKFPIAKAAELSEDAEGKAKKYNNGQKNAFCLFGIPVSWNGEFGFVEEYKDKFVGLSVAGMPRSIMHRIMQFYDMKVRGEKSYVWNTAYYLARFQDGKSDKVRNFCRQLQTDLFKEEKNYERIALAARWAEQELKDN